jgi:hypothetical protein
MPLLRENPDDFDVLVGRVAEHLGFPTAFVERDYWITEILRSISQPIEDYEANVIFKGGTSLSKGWRLLQRMSEDVDVIVTFGQISKNGRDRALKLVIERVERDIGVESTENTAEKSVHRSRHFNYPQRFQHGALSGERVLLELGTRGGPEPHQRLRLRSLIAEVACTVFDVGEGDFDEFAPLEIDTLAPERTLFEKLAALHHLAETASVDESRYENLGTLLRHAYDIAMLLENEATLAALRGLDRATMLKDIEDRSRESGWPWTPRPAGGYAESSAFGPAFMQQPAVAAAYARALELVVGGPKPSLAEVAELVRARADLL